MARSSSKSPQCEREDLLDFLQRYLLELDGLDMRREPIETRKATLASLLRNGKPGVRLNEHIAHSNGAAVFHHICKMGRGHRLEARRLALSVWPLAGLAEV